MFTLIPCAMVAAMREGERMGELKDTEGWELMGGGEIVTHRGRTFRVEAERDDDAGTPWDDSDGHGPVSEWTQRAKLPGEMVLTEDRFRKRYYDFAKACRMARREGWGFLPEPLVTKETAEGWTATAGTFTATDTDINKAISAVYAAHRATMTAREYAAGAAMRDFEFLRGWCKDDWQFNIVTVTELDEDGDDKESESLCGVDNARDEYLIEVALELADTIADRADEADAVDRTAWAVEMEASRPDLYQMGA